MKILNRQQTRELEQAQVNRGASYYELMENAGVGAGKILINRFSVSVTKEVVILCGKGNNGGDGFVIAKYLTTQGITPIIILVDGEPKTTDAAKAFDRALQSGVLALRLWAEKERSIEKIKGASYIVDAIYGIGFTGALKDDIKEIAELVNKSLAKVLSVDLPSGVDCDSGAVENTAFMADITVSFTTMKLGQVLYPAMDYCGDIVTTSVGISKWLTLESEYVMKTIDRESLYDNSLQKCKSANKGSVGTVATLCGARSMPGAAVLANHAALKSGAGLVKAIATKNVYPIIAACLPECLYYITDETANGTVSKNSLCAVKEEIDNSNALLIGCGLGKGEDVEAIVCDLVKTSKVPLIIDADGINAISKHIDVLLEKNVDIILTPHPGEMARLIGCTVKQVQANRYNYAKDFAAAYGVTLVLKGANTIIASPNGECVVNTTGNSGMAKGGSGDVLSGMIAAFVSQGINLFKAAQIAVYCHGVAGDIARIELGELSMQPSDIIQKLPEVYKSVLKP